MTLRFGPVSFAIVFCCVYALAFFTNLPLFLYYPLHGDFTWGPQLLKGAGPGMAWYGLMADAGIAALVLAFIVPDRLLDRIFRNYFWLFPCGAMLVCVYMLRQFLLQG
ncbi:MAG TPA: hypothetical protein VNW15_06420 [Rhizomicrobium sp.]|nr:hypothetical protein [Rhizomicrobium sp.]